MSTTDRHHFLQLYRQMDLAALLRLEAEGGLQPEAAAALQEVVHERRTTSTPRDTRSGFAEQGAAPGTKHDQAGLSISSLPAEYLGDDTADLPERVPHLAVALYIAFVIINFVALVAGGAQDQSSLAQKALAADTLVIIGLLRTNGFLHMRHRTWVRWAAIRLAGGSLFLLLEATLKGNRFLLAVAVAWTVAAAALAFLLLEPAATHARLTIGTTAFLLGSAGFIAGFSAVWPFSNLALESSIQAAAETPNKWADPDSGVLFELPSPWVQLAPLNKLFPSPTANAVFAHPRQRLFVAVLNESVSDRRLGSLRDRPDRYLDLVEVNRRGTLHQFVELARTDAPCGPFPGRRAIVKWQHEETQVVGAITAFDDGWGYWLLSLVAVGPIAGETLVKAIEPLERRIRSTKSIDARVDEAAARMAADYRCFSSKTALALCRFAQSKRLGFADAGNLSMRLISEGVLTLPTSARTEFHHLMSRAMDALTPQEKTEIDEALRESKDAIAAGTDSPPPAVARLSQFLRKGLASLSPEEELRLQALVETAVLPMLGDAN